MNREIERRFLVADDSFLMLPGREERMRQGYLSQRGSEPVIRLRLCGDKAFLTLKYRSEPGEIGRDEFEISLPPQTALQWLERRAVGTIIEKTRHTRLLPCGLTVYVDCFAEALQGLKMAEVEFQSEETAAAFRPEMSFFGREITLDHRFSNAALSQAPESTICAILDEVQV